MSDAWWYFWKEYYHNGSCLIISMIVSARKGSKSGSKLLFEDYHVEQSHCLAFSICVIRSIFSLPLAYINRCKNLLMQPFLMPSARHLYSASELPIWKHEQITPPHPHLSFSPRESQSAIPTAKTRDPPRCIFFQQASVCPWIHYQAGVRRREVLRRCRSRLSEASQRVGGRKSHID